MLQDDLLEKLLGVANRAKSFTSAGGAAIALGSGKHFVVSVTCGTSLDVGATVPLPSTLSGFRSLKSNALRCGDTDKEATIDGSVCRSARIKSMLVVPVGDLSDVRAVLAVFSSALRVMRMAKGYLDPNPLGNETWDLATACSRRIQWFVWSASIKRTV